VAFVLRRTLHITALVAFANLHAQSPPGNTDSDAAFRAGTQEILLDFVARDKHHNEVKNLRPEDVEVYEDGVRQTLKSFHYSRWRRTSVRIRGSTGASQRRDLRSVIRDQYRFDCF